MKTLKNLFKPDSFKNVEPKETWEFAQQILNQFIDNNSNRVYGNLEGGDWSLVPNDDSTHSAILLNIQPLKECEHKEAVYVEDQKETWFKCRECGKPVKAKGWESV